MDSKTYIEQYIERAKKAQKEYEHYSQEQVDQIVKSNCQSCS